MCPWVKVLAPKPDDPSSVPETCLVEGTDQFEQAVLWPLHMLGNNNKWGIKFKCEPHLYNPFLPPSKWTLWSDDHIQENIYYGYWPWAGGFAILLGQGETSRGRVWVTQVPPTFTCWGVIDEHTGQLSPVHQFLSTQLCVCVGGESVGKEHTPQFFTV